MNTEVEDRDDLATLYALLPEFVGAMHHALPATELAACAVAGYDHLLEVRETISARLPSECGIPETIAYRCGWSQRSVLDRLCTAVTNASCMATEGREFRQALRDISVQLIALGNESLEDELSAEVA